MPLHPVVAAVTERITDRSASTRSAYLGRLERAAEEGPARGALGCANAAHAAAGCDPDEKLVLRGAARPNVAIVSAYNDVLSAHQPLNRYPTQLKRAVREAGGIAQFAGGVPAMCDGVTQGRPGMELSLFSRDIVAMSTAIALSHDLFDGALLLGVCDKIVPGLLIGALSFGHLPVALVPAGPMPSGLSNVEKGLVRQRHAAGEVGRDALHDAEAASYHSPGTCTFYGTANTNQLVVEAMGLHLPGASFVNPGTPEREALTAAAGRAVTTRTRLGDDYTPIGRLVDERVIVNAVVALLASGGSTNHTLHLPAIAAAAGITLTWDDFAELAPVIPQLTRIYPNGSADVNHMHAAGGTAFLFGELLEAGLLHGDVLTMAGPGLERYTEPAPRRSGDDTVLRAAADPFASDSGLRVADGSLGRAVIKISAVAPDQRFVSAPARVFEDQGDFLAAFDRGELELDHVAVLRNQGPRANGMPELHKLVPALSVLQNRGHRVALVTDGRMSGASGKVLSAIHCTPEAAAGGPLSRVRDGDRITVDGDLGTLDVDGGDLSARDNAPPPDHELVGVGTGRELFAAFRHVVGAADEGASVFATTSARVPA